ncbi:MAG: DsbC family protein [Burkholderiaceae bacterium]
MWNRFMTAEAVLLAAATLTTAASADEAAVRATLERTFPQMPIQAIEKTPVPGIVEAAVGGKVFYITDDGRFILGGPLLDVAENRNLTAARLEQVNAIAFDSLNLDWAIKLVKGKGTRRIAIFEDPDCPFCKSLEKTLGEVDDLTIYIFLYPIDQLHPEAAAKSRAVWCAPDRAKAWSEIMRSGTVPAGPATCATPIKEIADFARQHRIDGTPTSILADGRRLVGAVPRTDLERALQKAAKP